MLQCGWTYIPRSDLCTITTGPIFKGTDRSSRNVVNYQIFRCVTSQKSESIMSVSVATLVGMQSHLLSHITRKLSPVACLAVPYISTLSHTLHHFLGKSNNIKCVFWRLLFFPETFLILRRIQRDVIINVLKSSCKVPFIKFHENCPVGAELFHADRGTDSR
jgi:hypothetical protein